MNKLEDLLKDKTDIIFDLDETISTLLIDWSQYKVRFLEKIQHSFPNVHEVADLDLSPIDIANQLIEFYGKEIKVLIDDFSLEYEREFYRGHNDNSLLTEYLLGPVEEKNIYLWTNNQRETAERVLTELELLGVFKDVVTASDTLFLKPHLEGFQRIWAQSSGKISQMIMIGDSRHDQLAAKNAQIEFINVRNLI